MIEELRRRTKRLVCVGTMLWPSGKVGQCIRQTIVPHRVERQSRPCSKASLLDLRDSYKGARCLIIGGSPSLIDLDLSNFRTDYTFYLNRAYLYRNRPAYGKDSVVMSNPHAFAEYGEEVLACNLDHVFLSGGIPQTVDFHDPRILIFSQWEQPRMYDGFFQFDLSQPLYHGTSVAFAAIQIAYWMGFQDIVLAGIDFKFDVKDGHFYPSSEREKIRTKGISTGNTDKMISSLEYCCKLVKGTGRARIVSLSSNRDFNFIEYRNLEDLA